MFTVLTVGICKYWLQVILVRQDNLKSIIFGVLKITLKRSTLAEGLAALCGTSRIISPVQALFGKMWAQQNCRSEIIRS